MQGHPDAIKARDDLVKAYLVAKASWESSYRARIDKKKKVAAEEKVKEDLKNQEASTNRKQQSAKLQGFLQVLKDKSGSGRPLYDLTTRLKEEDGSEASAG